MSFASSLNNGLDLGDLIGLKLRLDSQERTKRLDAERKDYYARVEQAEQLAAERAQQQAQQVSQSNTGLLQSTLAQLNTLGVQNIPAPDDESYLNGFSLTDPATQRQILNGYQGLLESQAKEVFAQSRLDESQSAQIQSLEQGILANQNLIRESGGEGPLALQAQDKIRAAREKIEQIKYGGFDIASAARNLRDDRQSQADRASSQEKFRRAGYIGLYQDAIDNLKKISVDGVVRDADRIADPVTGEPITPGEAARRVSSLRNPDNPLDKIIESFGRTRDSQGNPTGPKLTPEQAKKVLTPEQQNALVQSLFRQLPPELAADADAVKRIFILMTQEGYDFNTGLQQLLIERQGIEID